MFKVVVIIILVYLFLLLPAADTEVKVKGFFYHRGKHTKDQSIPENSLKAFEGAIAESQGIELDVQLSKDDVLYVFHDDDCSRMAQSKQKIEDMMSFEIDSLRLQGGHRIPRFGEVLSTVKGEVPLIVELKSCDRYTTLCSEVNALLKDYEGFYAIESFDPRIVMWFRKNAPKVLRGQLAMNPGNYPNPISGFFVWALFLNAYNRPHFIAMQKSGFGMNLGLHLFRLMGGTVIGWTFHKGDVIPKIADGVIFEYYNAWEGQDEDREEVVS